MTEPVIDANGCRWFVSDHAAERYAERFPDGPGIGAEIPSLRRAGRSVLKRIRRTAPAHASIPAARQAYFVSAKHPRAVFACRVLGRAAYRVVTCWPLTLTRPNRKEE